MAQNAIDLITRERKRQQSQFSVQHDDAHNERELLVAPFSILDDQLRDQFFSRDITWATKVAAKHRGKIDLDGQIAALVTASAMIAAEVDRLIRLREQSKTFSRAVAGAV